MFKPMLEKQSFIDSVAQIHLQIIYNTKLKKKISTLSQNSENTILTAPSIGV